MTLPNRIAAFGVFFLAIALFYAPLAYGCTLPEMLPGLYALLGTFIVCGLFGSWPRISKMITLCVIFILIQGWWLVWSPTFVDPNSTGNGLAGITVDAIRARSFNSMSMTTLLLLTFVVLCKAFGDPILRRFVLLAFALSGAIISICGIILKLSGNALMPFIWRSNDIDWNEFAFYRYHANAGAFLNLAWPFILVFTRRAFALPVSLAGRAIWATAALACGSALFLNASKASLAIGLLILPWPFLTWLMRMKWTTLVFVGLWAVLLLVGGLFASANLAHEAAFQRMTEVKDVSDSFDGRWAAYEQFAAAVPDVGAFGLGPGLFPLAFPYQTSPLGNVSPALRDYAHEDYLQGILEWGWLGVTWWTLLVLGGLYRGFKTYFRRARFTSKTDRHLVLGALLSVLGTLAQSFVDFPLQIPSLRLFFLVALAFCWMSPRMLRNPAAEPSLLRRKLASLPVSVSADEANEPELAPKPV